MYWCDGRVYLSKLLSPIKAFIQVDDDWENWNEIKWNNVEYLLDHSLVDSIIRL